MVCLGLCRRDVPDGSAQALVVQPGHPFERRELPRCLDFPRCSAVEKLGLVEPIDGLSQGIVITVAHAADKRFDAGFSKPLGVPNADVLRLSVAVANQAV